MRLPGASCDRPSQGRENDPFQIYYFRDQQGLEVDFVVPTGSEKLLLAEAKAVRSIKPAMGHQMNKLARAISRYKVEKCVIHLNPPKGLKEEFRSLSPEIKAVPVSEIGGHC